MKKSVLYRSHSSVPEDETATRSYESTQASCRSLQWTEGIDLCSGLWWESLALNCSLKKFTGCKIRNLFKLWMWICTLEAERRSVLNSKALRSLSLGDVSILWKTVFQLLFQMLLENIWETKIFPGHCFKSCINGLPEQVRHVICRNLGQMNKNTVRLNPPEQHWGKIWVWVKRMPWETTILTASSLV